MLPFLQRQGQLTDLSLMRFVALFYGVCVETLTTRFWMTFHIDGTCSCLDSLSPDRSWGKASWQTFTTSSCVYYRPMERQALGKEDEQWTKQTSCLHGAGGHPVKNTGTSQSNPSQTRRLPERSKLKAGQDEKSVIIS